MAGTALGFACRCGALRGAVTDATPAAATHAICHCRDCRSAYTHLGRPDPGSVGILQTTQDRIRITRGGEHLHVFRHSPRGALRWYAGCCGTPLALTPLKPRLAHAGLNVDRLEAPEAIGKATAEGFVPTASGGTRHRGAARMVLGVLSRMLAKNLDGTWRDTPFFDASGAPVREPRVSSREERAAALAALAR